LSDIPIYRKPASTKVCTKLDSFFRLLRKKTSPTYHKVEPILFPNLSQAVQLQNWREQLCAKGVLSQIDIDEISQVIASHGAFAARHCHRLVDWLESWVLLRETRLRMRATVLLIALLVAGCGLPSHIASVIPLASVLGRSGKVVQPAALPTAEATEAVGTAYTVIGPNPANARIEPVTIGPVFAQLQPGETVMVVSTFTGMAVSGSNLWYVIERDGRRLFVHSAQLQPAE
jgi:hypothetical protein